LEYDGHTSKAIKYGANTASNLQFLGTTLTTLVVELDFTIHALWSGSGSSSLIKGHVKGAHHNLITSAPACASHLPCEFQRKCSPK
jgi:hypothetical protein